MLVKVINLIQLNRMLFHNIDNIFEIKNKLICNQLIIIGILLLIGNENYLQVLESEVTIITILIWLISWVQYKFNFLFVFGIVMYFFWSYLLYTK